MQKWQQWESASDADWGLAVETVPMFADMNRLFERSRMLTEPRSWEWLRIPLWSERPLTAPSAGSSTTCCSCLFAFLNSIKTRQTKQNTQAALRPRQIPFATICELIANAAPGPNNLEQQSRYRRTLRIWADLFTLFDETDAATLERASRHWPATLQRRFASALRIRTRKRWPYNRFRYFTVCPGFKRSEAMIVRDLTAVNPP
jgi:hypothetical protein